MWKYIWAETLLFSGGWIFLSYKNIRLFKSWPIGTLALNHEKVIGLPAIVFAAMAAFSKFGPIGAFIVAIGSIVLITPIIQAIFKVKSQSVSLLMIAIGFIASISTF